MKLFDPSAYRCYRSGVAERNAIDFVLRKCSSKVLISYIRSGYVYVKYCNRTGFAKYQLFPASPYVEQRIGHLLYSMNLKLASL